MLSIGKIGTGHGSAMYYVESVADGREDYYTGAGEAKGEWYAPGAQRAAGDEPSSGGPSHARQDGEVRSHDFLRMLQPTSSQQTVLGYDLTFSAPKSVSVLFGVGDIELSIKVRDAHDRAVREALDYVQREATWARRGKGGRELLRGEDPQVAMFRHRSSRAGDPQLHTHAVVANETTAGGRKTALDGRAFYAHAKTAGYLYQAALRAELTESVGLAWGPVEKGTADVSGIDSAVLDHFSQRSHEIAAHLEKTGYRSRRAREIATLDSRRGKMRDIPADRLHQEWRSRAEEHGFGRLELDALLDARVAGPSVQPDLAEEAHHLASSEGLTLHLISFDRRDVLRAWATAHREGAHIERIGQLTDRWMRTEDAVPIEPGDAHPLTGRRHSTPELITTQRELLETADRRRADGAGQVSPEAVNSGVGLSDAQHRGVEAPMTSGDGVQVVRAPAGTGKTRMLGAARATWDGAGLRTVGCALSARAAFELEAEAGIDSTTIARLRADLESGTQLGRDVVLVVDEAGMVGTRDLAALSRHAELGGAKLVLVGDDRQLPEIEAGGAFSKLADQLDAVELHEVRRQRDQWDRDAPAALRNGRISEWADRYREHDRIVARPTAAEVRTALVTDWWLASREEGSDALMLAHRRSDVADLNDRARALVKCDGGLGEEELYIEGRSYSVGDQVLARRNDRHLDVINGARGVVTRVDLEQRSLEVDFARAGTRALDSRYVEDGHLHYGYAMTAHAAQGITVDKTFVLGTDDLYREWRYTALSRHETSARFYAVSPGSTERAPPGLDPDDDLLTVSIEARLGRSHREALASETASSAAIKDARAALAEPPSALTKRIGTRPENPLDRDQWTRAAATLIRTVEFPPDLDIRAPEIATGLDMGM